MPPAGSHGGDGPAIAAALGLDPGSVLDLSMSLNPLAPDPVPVVARHLDAVRVYPEPRRGGGGAGRGDGSWRENVSC